MNSRSLVLLFLLSVSAFAALAPAAAARPGVVAPRIVNADGEATGGNATPWQVALVPRNSSGTAIQSAVFCGGTVRDTTHIVTAAHCLEETNPEDIAVVAGMFDRESTSEGGTRQVRNVSAITNDVNYDSATSENDAAVLTLASALTPNSSVAVLPVVSQATTHAQLIGEDAAISGWGLTDPDDSNSQPGPLLQALIEVFPDSACDNYGPLFNPNVMLCAGRDNGSDFTDTCQGDSGGPLARRPGDTGWTFDALIGIVSFGIGCADPDFPGVYTDLSNDGINAVASNPTPAARPTYSSTPSISGTARVGETLTCNPGSWTGNPTISYLWIAVPLDANGDPDFDNAFAVGDEQQLPLIAEDVGKVMLCIVRAQNSGGWVELADAVGPVAAVTAPPPPPVVDVTRPIAGFTSRRCVRRTCRLTVLVNDIGGVQGMRLRASVRRLNCPRGRRGRRCRRPRTLRPRQVAPGIFRIVVRRLRPGRYRFRATPIDAAGNRGRTTSVVLRVRRRR